MQTLNKKTTAPGCLKDAAIHEDYKKNNWFCAWENCPRHCEIHYKPPAEKPKTAQLEFNFE